MLDGVKVVVGGGVKVLVGVLDGVKVCDGVKVLVGVFDGVKVRVGVRVCVGVLVEVLDGV